MDIVEDALAEEVHVVAGIPVCDIEVFGVVVLVEDGVGVCSGTVPRILGFSVLGRDVTFVELELQSVIFREQKVVDADGPVNEAVIVEVEEAL